MESYQPGIRFNGFKICNGRVFDNVYIPLANQGIVSILGKNGAGKSTIFSLLQAPFFGSTPTGHKKDELVKNENDSSLEVDFERSTTPHTLSFTRTNKKWGYKIIEGATDLTPHTFNDAVKKAATLLGITQAEFEGSIHLTQGAQHILITGKPAKRKEYISNFFGIDDSYDQVQLAAKEKLQKVKDQITKVSALSHTKNVLQQELGLISYTDPQSLIAKIALHDKEAILLVKELQALYNTMDDIQNYERYAPIALVTANPQEDLKTDEDTLVALKTKVSMAADIRKRNIAAREVNTTIKELKESTERALNRYPGLNTFSNEELKAQHEALQKLRYANGPLEPLRKEVLTLPDLKILPSEAIETELNKVYLELRTQHRHLTAMTRGECPECGSTFEATKVHEVEATVKDLDETYSILKEDFEIVKQRNQTALRRQYLVQTIGDTPIYAQENATELEKLTGMLKAKSDYDDAQNTLKILKAQAIQDEPNVAELQGQIENTEKNIKLLKNCIEALQKLPQKPTETMDEIHTKIMDVKQKQTLSESQKAQDQQLLGQINADNERLVRLQTQLKDVNIKLKALEGLKKDEFFWSKMVEAYGPKGLRVEQLKKMMDVVIRRLPVYTSILFDEKGLTFEHRCDANNIEILACRQEHDDKGDIIHFKHDISSFSGGEKGKMSTAFILSLADCVPPSKRSNILILDEVDSALDADGQFRFTNDLLPMLRENYESVFVASHSQEIQQAAVYDQVWTVVKDNHWSKINMVKM